MIEISSLWIVSQSKMVRVWFHRIAHSIYSRSMVLVKHRSREWSLESLERYMYEPLTPLMHPANDGKEGKGRGSFISEYPSLFASNSLSRSRYLYFSLSISLSLVRPTGIISLIASAVFIVRVDVVLLSCFHPGLSIYTHTHPRWLKFCFCPCGWHVKNTRLRGLILILTEGVLRREADGSAVFNQLIPLILVVDIHSGGSLNNAPRNSFL